MLEGPSGDSLTAFTRAVNDVTRAAILCLAQRLDAARIQVLYADSFGIGSFTEPASNIPNPLWPDTARIQWTEPRPA